MDGTPWPLDPQSPDAKRLADEVTFWRQDAAARLATALDLVEAATKRDDQDMVAWLTVHTILPTRGALTGALSGDLYWPLCEGCEVPIQEGDAVFTYTEGEVAHVDCASPKLALLPEHACRHAEDDEFKPEGIRRTLARAEAFLECRGEDTPPATESAEAYNARFDPADEAGQEVFNHGFFTGWMHATYPEGWPDDDEESQDAFRRATDGVALGEAWDAHRDKFFARLPLAAVGPRHD